MDLAFYGTLRDPDILALAAGEDLSPCYRGTKPVSGWACYYIVGQTYPLLRAQDGASALFSLYQNCSASAWEHLLEYEGDEYDWVKFAIESEDYRIFLPRASVLTHYQPWDLESFQAKHKSAYLQTLR